jgi:hypothetical protein
MNYTCRYPVNSTDGSAPESDMQASRVVAQQQSTQWAAIVYCTRERFTVSRKRGPETGQFNEHAAGALVSLKRIKEVDRAGKAEEVGFEPTKAFTLHDFQSCSLDHYETPPCGGMMMFHARRREWDSNPRGLSPYRFSRAAHSTTLTSLRCGV